MGTARPAATAGRAGDSTRVERSAQPFDPIAVDRDAVEAAWQRARQPAQEVACREHQALPLGGADARCRAAEAVVTAHPHFDEHQRAIAVAHHQVDLATACPGPACDPIIALHQHQPGGAETGERPSFGSVAERFRRRGLGRHRRRRSKPLLDGSKLVEAAAAAAGGQQYPAPALYVVATPIGNLADMTLRALHVLAVVDAIACEDTRHSSALLRHFGLAKPLLAVHEHNERTAAGAILERLARGERVAYVSDAGTPALSDPGAELVAAARDAGYRVVPIPGASSALTALAAAGDAPSTGFAFVGFLAARGSERARAIVEVSRAAATQIVFEAPHRIAALAAELAAACPERRTTLCRELTKQFETIATMPARDLPAWLATEPNRCRGEFVIVLHALAVTLSVTDGSAHDVVLAPLLAALPLKQAVALAGEITGAPRNTLYARALEIKPRA